MIYCKLSFITTGLIVHIQVLNCTTFLIVFELICTHGTLETEEVHFARFMLSLHLLRFVKGELSM